MKNGKGNAMKFFKPKTVQPASINDDAPSRPPKIQGPLKNNGAAMATVLRKHYIVVAIGLLAAVIMGGSYYAVDLSESPSTAAGSTIHPSSGAPNMALPHRIATPSVPGSTGKSQSPNVPAIAGSGGAGGAGQSASTTPVPPAAPPAPSAQDLAFTSAISGSGGGGSALTWPHAHSAAATHAPSSGLSAAAAAALLKPHSSVYSTHLVRKEASIYEVLQGSVIAATMDTGIKSDLPGKITATISNPVYNTSTGAFVLIPGGSKLVGTYQSKVMAGGTRVGVAWTRILLPNGTYINLGGMPGTSARGYSGFHDLVNNHTWKVFKNAMLMSVINVGMALASPTSSMASGASGMMTGNMALQDGEQSLSQTFGQAEAQMLQRYINIAPTLTIRTGYAFNVVVTKDLIFAGPYKHGVRVGTTMAAHSAAPSMPNPYG
jgi:type IV secretion system protein VirB10